MSELVKEIEDFETEIRDLLEQSERTGEGLIRIFCTDAKLLCSTLQRARDALRWIPVSERLPVESRLYWVTVLRPIPVNGKRLHVTQRFFDVLRGAFIIGEDKVLAWLELPAPYTPEEK